MCRLEKEGRGSAIYVHGRPHQRSYGPRKEGLRIRSEGSSQLYLHGDERNVQKNGNPGSI